MGGAAAAAVADGATAWAAQGAHEAARRAERPGGAARHDGLQALCTLARLHHVAADPASLAHQLALASGDPVGVDELLRGARLLGLRARLVRSSAARLVHAPLPALALVRAGCAAQGAAQGADGATEVCLLAQCDGSRVLVAASGQPEHDAGRADGDAHASDAAAAARIEPLAHFAERWTGQLILVSSRASLVGAMARFDFSWFVPAIVKYRALLAEVLLVSFVLQLFALVSPLFFQVVMDKVLVHKALTTLDVLVIGLVIVVVFESVLSAVRSYIMARGHGVDTIYENDATPGNTDVAAFIGDIRADQLWFRRAGSSLDVGIIGTADLLRVSGWYSGDAYRIERFTSGDGRTLSGSQVQGLVDAMAGFAPPAMGQTHLPDLLASQLAPVLAANWH